MKELVKLLISHGWRLDRINGSHHIMIKDDQTITVPTPGCLTSREVGGLKC